MSLATAFGVLVYAAVAACLAELLAHVWVYRTPDFKRLVRTFEVENARKRKAEAQQAGGAGGGGGAAGADKNANANTPAARTAKRAEQAAQQAAGELASARARANMTGMFVMIPAFMLMGKVFGAHVVLGRLPFTPPGWMQGVTHRGLEGDDVREFGAAFLSAIALHGVRVNLTKLLGSGPRKAEAAMAAKANDLGARWAQAQRQAVAVNRR
jgi:hypothetical protein